jgi:hypothetical protein
MRSESETQPPDVRRETGSNDRVNYVSNGGRVHRLRFLPPELFRPVRFRGTFAPFFRASDKPIAIACLRLFTVLPLLPDLSVPFFRRRIALSTRFDAALPYFRRPEDLRAAISSSVSGLVVSIF